MRPVYVCILAKFGNSPKLSLAYRVEQLVLQSLYFARPRHLLSAHHVQSTLLAKVRPHAGQPALAECVCGTVSSGYFALDFWVYRFYSQFKCFPLKPIVCDFASESFSTIAEWAIHSKYIYLARYYVHLVRLS